MSTTRPARLIVVVFAALAMTVFVNARFTFAQDAPDSGTSVDPNWARTGPPGPAIDEDVETADRVLEIPQATCAKDGAAVPCDSTEADATPDGNDDGSQTINAPQPGAPPPTLDDDTASAGTPDPDWGTVDEYQNQTTYAVPAYGVPYAVYAYPTTVVGTTNRRSQLPASSYAPMSSPITQAARPPLNQGPWMTPSTMSAFNRPAGSPMMGMTTTSPAWGLHH